METNETPKQKRERLQRDIELAQQTIDRAKGEIERLDRSCRHEWGEAIYCPIYHEAHTIPGDPPGTMGVDWRGPCHVPARTDKRWKRVCKLCGKVEFTTSVNRETVETPRF